MLHYGRLRMTKTGGQHEAARHGSRSRRRWRLGSSRLGAGAVGRRLGRLEPERADASEAAILQTGENNTVSIEQKAAAGSRAGLRHRE